MKKINKLNVYFEKETLPSQRHKLEALHDKINECVRAINLIRGHVESGDMPKDSQINSSSSIKELEKALDVQHSIITEAELVLRRASIQKIVSDGNLNEDPEDPDDVDPCLRTLTLAERIKMLLSERKDITERKDIK